MSRHVYHSSVWRFKSLFWVCCCAVISLQPQFCLASGNQEGGGFTKALNLTVTLHPTVKSKLEELKALGFDLESAEAQRYPTFSVQATTSTNVAQNNSLDQYGVVAVVQQPLWAGGRIDGAIDQSGIKLKVGKLSLLATRRQLMESTATAYTAVTGNRSRLEAAELNVQEHEKLKLLISRRESGGIASSADVLLASSRLSQAMAQRIQLDGALKRSLNDLLALTQQSVSVLEQIPEVSSVVFPVSDKVLGEIEKSSAVVQQRLLEVDLAKAGAEVAFANMMPTLHAKVEQDIYTATQHGDIPQGTRIGVVLQGSVEGLGFSGWNRVKSSDARVDAAKKDVDSARNDARRQAQSLFTDYESLRMILESNKLLVKSTEETLSSFMRQYDAGRKSWVDVLNTQRELSDARMTLEQTRSSLMEMQLRLAIQLGQFDIPSGVMP